MRLKYNFESKKKPVVVASMVRSSLKQNERFGGIHPLVAVASHKAHLPTAIEEVLAKHNGPIDLIAATRGPGALLHADEETQLTNVGMRACLEVGLRQGEALARARGIPFLGVHHMQAHALTPRLLEDGPHPEFPYLSLLVSGGHTLLLLTKSVVRHEILASTLDIAIGDMLDKLAKTLRIPWGESMPGAALEAYCTDDRTSSAVPGLWPVSDAQRAQWHLTRPLRSKINVDGKRYERMAFSFGGLGSAAERALEGSRHDGERRAIGAETMKVAFEHVAAKVIAALRTMSPIPSTLVVSGGVGRNTFLRHILRRGLDADGFGGVRLLAPPLDLCSDNATMIGWTAIEMYGLGYTSDLSVQAVPKWPLDLLLEQGHRMDPVKLAERHPRFIPR